MNHPSNLDTVCHTETLPLNDTLGALTDQGLVGVDSDANHTGFVVCEGRNLITSAVSHKEHPGGTRIFFLEPPFFFPGATKNIPESYSTYLRRRGFVVLAPVVLVDSLLAETAGALY